MAWQTQAHHITYNDVYLLEVGWKPRVQRHDEAQVKKIVQGFTSVFNIARALQPLMSWSRPTYRRMTFS